jgi:general stress protein 26
MPTWVIAAEKGIGMTESEVGKFLLECRSNLLLGTVDATGDSNIHPVWYYYDPGVNRFYFFTDKGSNKEQNISKKSRVYFDVDDDNWPCKGVRGKGNAKVVADRERALAHTEKILSK